MKKISTLIIFILFFTCKSDAQFFQQFFDGADTSVSNSIIIEYDTSSSNIWQVGAPHKNIFDSASTRPNAIVTDTSAFYPVNNVSRFSFVVLPWVTWGIYALQWNQKIDMDPGT